jgi:hypothetical protein
MKYLRLSGLLLLLNFAGFAKIPDGNTGTENKIASLSRIIDPYVLQLAFKGYFNIQDSISQNEKFLAIADFSKSSTEKRFYLISMKDTTLVHVDYVSHGKYSGELYANSFSNEKHSLKTSLGFYKVAESYSGCHGLSIRLDGLDQGYNDNARTRAIVMHAAAYAEPIVISKLGRLGKSFGCPALPSNGFSLIADRIKESTILFHYYPDENYLKNCIWLR